METRHLALIAHELHLAESQVAVVAALLPVAMGIFAIAVATGLLALLGTWFDFSFFTPNMISMMGLAVGIDYSLFIVSRFLRHQHPRFYVNQGCGHHEPFTG